jgi:hypothetical protein
MDTVNASEGTRDMRVIQSAEDIKRTRRVMRYVATLPAPDKTPVRGWVPGVEYLTGGYGLYMLDWK